MSLAFELNQKDLFYLADKMSPRFFVSQRVGHAIRANPVEYSLLHLETL
jgi:hypothetical protein